MPYAIPLRRSPPVPPSYPAGWPAGALASAAIGEAGLVLGAGTVLAPMGEGRELALDPERVRALLSVAAGRRVSARALQGIAAAARHWRCGDAALANLRLVFAGLPRLEEPQALHKRQAADWLLANDLTPRALMRELGLDASALDAAPTPHLGKYNPDQPRVPAGSGIESGRWSGTAGRGALGSAPPDGPIRASQLRFDTVDVAQAGPIVPGGVGASCTTKPNPFDPKGLNKPPTLEEQQAIVDTFNRWLAGTKGEQRRLRIGPYDSRPHQQTGAVLPNGAEKYEECTVRAPSRLSRGDRRLLIGSSGKIFYTSNHCRNFYRFIITGGRR